MPPARILIVEDDPVAALVLQDLLHGEGHDCIGIAATGAEAERLAADLHPDLVMLDIALPGDQDGIDTAHALARQGEAQVVYITSNTDAATYARARSTSPVAFIAKPFAEAEVKQALNAALERIHLLAALRDSRAISTAVGLLMARHNLDAEAAFARLRQEARDRRERMADLASALLEGQGQPE